MACEYWGVQGSQTPPGGRNRFAFAWRCRRQWFGRRARNKNRPRPVLEQASSVIQLFHTCIPDEQFQRVQNLYNLPVEGYSEYLSEGTKYLLTGTIYVLATYVDTLYHNYKKVKGLQNVFGKYDPTSTSNYNATDVKWALTSILQNKSGWDPESVERFLKTIVPAPTVYVEQID